MKPSAVELLVCIGVFGCICPISSNMFLMYTVSFALMKSAPSSASAADDMTALITCAMLRMAPLFGRKVTSDLSQQMQMKGDVQVVSSSIL
jgi:hypothetical protein